MHFVMSSLEMDGIPCKKRCCYMFTFSVDVLMRFIRPSQKEQK